MDAATTDLLRVSLRAVLTADRAKVAAQLDELGWDDVLADDPAGATRLLFETRGEVLSAADSLGPLLAARLGLGVGAVALPAGLVPDGRSSATEGADLVVDGLVLDDVAGTDVAVPVDGPGGLRLGIVAGSKLAADDVEGIDADLGIRRVRARVALGDVRWIEAPGAAGLWDDAVAAGRWALAAELVGVARNVVREAVAYTIDRKQYGRPIGSFQAVQHRLASAHAATVGASHVVAEAAASRRPWDALVAKCLAGRAAEESCTQAQQAYGAIGFTWEHPFHRSLRRTYALDRLLGGWRDLEVEIGRRLRESGEVPRLGSL